MMKITKSPKVLVTAIAMLLGFGLSGTTLAQDKDPIVVGYIGSFASDTGLSTIRGAEMAIDELNAAGGVLGGRMIEFVMADTREDVAEGIKAYEYLAETENVDFIISGSIDDVSLGWLPRMAEYKIPTLDTWTSYVGIIDLVVNEYDKYKNVLHEYRMRRGIGDHVHRLRKRGSGTADGLYQYRSDV